MYLMVKLVGGVMALMFMGIYFLLIAIGWALVVLFHLIVCLVMAILTYFSEREPKTKPLTGKFVVLTTADSPMDKTLRPMEEEEADSIVNQLHMLGMSGAHKKEV